MKSENKPTYLGLIALVFIGAVGLPLLYLLSTRDVDTMFRTVDQVSAQSEEAKKAPEVVASEVAPETAAALEKIGFTTNVVPVQVQVTQ